MNITDKPTTPSNYFKGRFDSQGFPINPDVIIIHVAVGNLQTTFNTFNNPQEQKSSHYFVEETGNILRFAPESATCWHAGFVVNPTARLVKERIGKYSSPNSYSIGIENAGEYPGDTTPGDFTSAQYDANGWLVAQLSKKWNIPLDRDHVIGHKEIRSDKTCPGSKVSIERILEAARAYTGAVNNPEPQTVVQLKAEIQAVLNKYNG